MSKGPGRWQRLLLDGLDQRPYLIVSNYVSDSLGRSMTPAEYSAVSRAARALAATGAARHEQAWSPDYRGRRTNMAVLLRPDVDPSKVGLQLASVRPGRPKS